MRLLVLIIGLALAGAVKAQDMKPLTPEERRVIVDKGTEAPFRAVITSIAERGFTVAASAVRRCTVRRTSSMPGAAGRVSTTKSPVP